MEELKLADGGGGGKLDPGNLALAKLRLGILELELVLAPEVQQGASARIRAVGKNKNNAVSET